MSPSALFKLKYMKNAAKIVNSAIIGMDFETVVVSGKSYAITPPTIHKISGAGYYLSGLGDFESVRDLLMSLSDIKDASKALSWFIQGNDELSEELSHGTLDEVVAGLEIALSLISVENFMKLSVLAKNVRNLTAKQK